METVKPRSYLLRGMIDEIDWQCAYEAAGHAESGKVNAVVYEVPGGDREYTVVYSDTSSGCVIGVRRTA